MLEKDGLRRKNLSQTKEQNLKKFVARFSIKVTSDKI
jgi:hypothetical protein